MAKSTIYHDVILNFGKYKGTAAEVVLEKDPGYFLWCATAGTHNLDPVITNAVLVWAVKNKKEAERTVASAEKYARERGQKPGKVEAVEDKPDDSYEVVDSVTTDVSFAKSIESRPAAWGSW